MSFPAVFGNVTILAPDITNASDDVAFDGSVKVKATYVFDRYPPNPSPHTSIQFSLDWINWFDPATEASDAYYVFSGLQQGIYTVYVRARKTESSPWEPGDISAEFTIGYSAVDCSSLSLGTITTTAESTVGAHDGTITVGSSGTYAREFRLNAGAWQSSNVFGGLAAGTYNVQVRYVAYPACTTSRSVNLVNCNVAITSVVVTHETKKFADDGTIQINNSGSAGPFQYSYDGGTTWVSTNSFAHLSPGVYSVKVKDSSGCIDSRSVTVEQFKSVYFRWPIVNSHRMVATSGPIMDGLSQNFDNTLFKSMRYIGSTTDDYKEKFQLNDSLRVQWRSSYNNHLMEVRRVSDSGLVKTLPVVKQHAFLNQQVETLGKVANGTGGKIQVFFIDELPLFSVVGQEITIANTSTALDGQTFKIEDIINGTGDAAGNVVLILTAAWPGGSGAIDCHVKATYDLLPYDVFECAVDYSSLSAGDYFFRLTLTDDQFTTSVGETEPFNTSVKVDDCIQIVFFNNDNGFNMYYDTAIQNQIRVAGEIRLGEPGGQQNVMEDSNRDLIKLMEYVTRIVDITIPHIPNYLRERISLALGHDVIQVNGVYYQKEDKPTYEPGSLDDLVTVKIKLRQLDFIAENSDDGGLPFSPDNPRIHDFTFDETFN